MKLLSFLTVTAFCTVAFFSACNNEGDAVRDAAVKSAGGGATDGTAATAPVPNANPATPTPEPAQNAAGVWHYTCPKGCAGGAGSAVACPKCGSTLAHNAAYHPNANPATTPATNPAAKTPEPAQNLAGVWHYTCASGCAGGAGSAVACPKCGKTLAHNATYHQ